jgi:hypothetical protein
MEVTAVAAVTPKAKKAPAVVKSVVMTDGRTVLFSGDRKMGKETTVGEMSVTTRFDFENGETRSVTVGLDDALALKFMGAGVAAKVAVEAYGEGDTAAMVGRVDAVLKRLAAGEWGAERGEGNGLSGENVVVQAIVEASGKSVDEVKTFLAQRLEAGKAAGLTLKKLYASFRKPDTATAPIIARLEKPKKGLIDADEALKGLMG